MWIWRRNLSCFWWKYTFLLLKLYYGLFGLSLSTRRGEVISQCSPPCPQCPSTLPTSSLLYYNWGHYTTSYYAILLLLLYFYCYRGHYTTTLFYYYTLLLLLGALHFYTLLLLLGTLYYYTLLQVWRSQSQQCVHKMITVATLLWSL